MTDTERKTIIKEILEDLIELGLVVPDPTPATSGIS